MGAALKIVDFDDPTFDPFVEFDKAQGLADVIDPHPTFAEMRRRAPVLPGDLRTLFGLPENLTLTGMKSYVVLGYDEVTQAFGDAENFSIKHMARFYEHGFGKSINAMDAPEHTLYRRLFQKAFLPNIVSKWGDTLVPKVVNRLIDRFCERGRANLVAEFASQYPFHFIYGQLDLPESDLEVFHKLTMGLTVGVSDPAHMLEASTKLGAYITDLVEHRRKHPGDDIVSVLAQAEVDGQLLPDDVLLGFLRQLMNAGGDTTYRGTSILLAALLTHPDQLDAVRKDRSLVPRAVDEALRWDCPVVMLSRTPLRDVVLGGVPIPAGAKVDIVASSANRDERHFPDPDRFDIFRPPARHFGFGFGPHICIGQHLARLEMTRALNALLDRLPNLRLDEAQPAPVICGLQIRSPTSLHVKFG